MSFLRLALPAFAATLALTVSACQTHEATAAPAQGSPEIVMPGKADDVPAFDSFIATRPTPAAFRARYPDVRLVLPGDISTKELRMDRSRYFAQLDDQGRITGGKFM